MTDEEKMNDVFRKIVEGVLISGTVFIGTKIPCPVCKGTRKVCEISMTGSEDYYECPACDENGMMLKEVK